PRPCPPRRRPRPGPRTPGAERSSAPTPRPSREPAPPGPTRPPLRRWPGTARVPSGSRCSSTPPGRRGPGGRRRAPAPRRPRPPRVGRGLAPCRRSRSPRSALPAPQAAKGRQVSDVTVVTLRRLQDHGQLPQAPVSQQEAERPEADAPGAAVLVAIEPRAEHRLGVVQVEGCDAVEPHAPVELARDLLDPPGRPDVVSRSEQVTRVEAEEETLGPADTCQERGERLRLAR